MTQGHQLFADELSELAMRLRDQRLSALAAEIAEPLRVAVQGRPGVGRRTVTAALIAAGVRGVGRPETAAAADLVVHVLAELAKPEDLAALRAVRGRPVLVVLNKTDLPRHGDIDAIRSTTGRPVEPLSALFALAAAGDRLDIELWSALRGVAAHPADLRSAEHFVGGPHPVPYLLRERLCTTVDLSGIERLLDLARAGGTPAQARALLGRLSGVDAVVSRLEAMSALTYHRRMSEVVIRLEALAVADDRIDEFLVSDATVAARLTAAAAALELPDEPTLGRARRWQARRSAPIGTGRRACAADVARGSLRAWAAAWNRT
ncbi:hypothetical protein [Mycolicibacter minnesotensis]